MDKQVNQTINAYNKYDDIYDNETIDFWNYFPKSTINIFVNNLLGKKVLNLGSGPGRDALLLKDRGLEVTCVDASAKMIERTNKLGFESIETDFLNLKLPNKSLDGIWAYTSLLHVSKDEMTKVLLNLHDILKDKGILLVGMREGEFEGNKESDSMPNTYRYFRYYTEQELKDVIQPLGFEYIYQERYQPNNKIYLSQIYKKI